MRSSLTIDALWEAEDTAEPAARPKVRPPLLMGDVVSARGGVPELLIQWRRAEGQDDPDPQ